MGNLVAMVLLLSIVYIITLSTRKMYDEGGRLHFCVDKTLRRRLET